MPHSTAAARAGTPPLRGLRHSISCNRTLSAPVGKALLSSALLPTDARPFFQDAFDTTAASLLTNCIVQCQHMSFSLRQSFRAHGLSSSFSCLSNDPCLVGQGFVLPHWHGTCAPIAVLRPETHAGDRSISLLHERVDMYLPTNTHMQFSVTLILRRVMRTPRAVQDANRQRTPEIKTRITLTLVG